MIKYKFIYMKYKLNKDKRFTKEFIFKDLVQLSIDERNFNVLTTQTM